ncbi:MAG TPA: D-alanyl-D-alanine carboxypeptidase family protein [Pseudolabrys sp.]|nr:D-alanyl-D-alanine carboxypeptidase family protein [Pseudolabrys sp.]
MSHRLHFRFAPIIFAGLLAVGTLSPRGAQAEAQLLVDADTGKVLHAENATYPWYPASVTKLMTLYTTLRAVKEGKISFDSMITVSRNAVAQQPVKMGFAAGTQLTLDNALKMMMVKSANDMAVTIAEGVGGSIDGFSDMMNANARRLGMTQTNYVNPNGLPADGQITSARDLAILARALIREFPEHSFYWHIPAIKYGSRVTRNYNPLLTRYPGADGMKTGFICASGYNLVATATRNGKHLIAVVLGAWSGGARAQKAAQLLERGFAASNLSWLTPSLGTVDGLVPVEASPPNLREEMCGGHRRKPSEENDEEEDTPATTASSGTPSEGSDSSAQTFALSNLKAGTGKFVLGPPVDDNIEPIVVFTGSPKNPDKAPVAVAAKKKTKKTKTADADEKPKAEKPAAKPAKKTKTAEGAKPKKPAAQ